MLSSNVLNINSRYFRNIMRQWGDEISHPFLRQMSNRGPWSLYHLSQYPASDHRYGLIINPWPSKTSWSSTLFKSTVSQPYYRAKPIIWTIQASVSPLLAAGFTGLHVMQTRWFLRRKLQTHMRKTTISSRYWSKMVKGVNSLEWRTCGLADLWYTTQFSASSALSPSDCGHVPALCLFHPIWPFFCFSHIASD